MNPELLASHSARFERTSTGTWLSLHVDDLGDFGFPVEQVPRLNMLQWLHAGKELIPDFELVTIGDDIE